jgi:hypothetical protein
MSATKAVELVCKFCSTQPNCVRKMGHKLVSSLPQVSDAAFFRFIPLYTFQNSNFFIYKNTGFKKEFYLPVAVSLNRSN